jgi:DNA-binding response OmpR family regulator
LTTDPDRRETETASGQSAEQLLRTVEPEVLRGEGAVLVVDDEHHVLTAAARILEHFGFQTFSARSGREAIEIFRAHALAIRVVLLDLSMPDLDGEETLRALRLQDAGVRVVFSSGYDEPEARRRFRIDAGASFLQKPYSARDLTAKIREAMVG